MTMNFPGIVRSTLRVVGRKCIETHGDRAGSVDFTYPMEYVDGIEFACLVTINPDGTAKTVLYKMEKLVDMAETDGATISGLLSVVEKFIAFCKRCDQDKEHLNMIKSSKINPN